MDLHSGMRIEVTAVYTPDAAPGVMNDGRLYTWRYPDQGTSMAENPGGVLCGTCAQSPANVDYYRAQCHSETPADAPLEPVTSPDHIRHWECCKCYNQDVRRSSHG
jgi:hypothetical protein